MKAAIDFETFYNRKISLTNMSVLDYLKHPDFYAYMVAIKREDGYGWVGPIDECPWHELNGTTLFAHNRNFEEVVMNFSGLKLQKGQEAGDLQPLLDKFTPDSFHCTADMGSYLLYGRPLDEVMKNRYGVKVDKTVRANMMNVHYDSLTRGDLEALAQYCLEDTEWTLKFAIDEFDNWPEHEREISRATSEMCWQGLPIDKARLERGISDLNDKVEWAIDTIPWSDGEREGATSAKKFNEWCRSNNIEPPKSTAKDDLEVVKWRTENPAGSQVMEAIHVLRGAGNYGKKMKTMLERTNENGWLPYGLKYFGASPTGRDSGDAGFNTQNMPRGELYGVDLRSCIAAPDGKVLLSADFSQIEPRGAAYLAGEEGLLEIARSGVDWYEAMARSFGMYDDPRPLAEVDPPLRYDMKQRCLGCQYKMGANRFALMTGMEYEQAVAKVRLFRRKLPQLVKLWDELEKDMHRAALSPEKVYEIELPSGRIMRYENVSSRGGLTANIIRNGRKMKLKYWAGILIENVVQAFARDIFMDRALALRHAGHNIILRVHDEFLFIGDKSSAESEKESIEEIMTTAPEWCDNFPLATDCHILERYGKV